VERISRRGFLGATATAAAAFAAGCAGPAKRRPPAVATTTLPAATTSTTEGPVDWSALRPMLDGTLLLPGDPGYPAASVGYNPRFDDIKPAAVARCATVSDVQRCVAFARERGGWAVARSGGHSYAGYSTCTGLVIDTSPLASVSVSPAGTAMVGGGARLIDVYAGLDQSGLAIAAGSCPSVGIAGLTLGGGMGVIGRRYGLTCDSLAGVEIVTADATLHRCDATDDAELLWGSQGGGGGNFGVVTSFELTPHRIDPTVVWTQDWPWDSARDVLPAWMAWAPAAPDEMWSDCLLSATGPAGGPPVLRTTGVWLGTPSGLAGQLDELVRAVGSSPDHTYSAALGWMDAVLLEAGCSGQTVAQCHLPTDRPGGTVARQALDARCDLFTAAIPAPGVDVIVGAVEARQADPRLAGGGAQFDALGGAIGRVAPGATAWVHRDATCSVQYAALPGPGTADVNRAWLDATWSAMRPYASGQAYQNYIDPNLPDWADAYYGANLGRLERLKATVDPSGFWHFAQAIPGER